MIKNILIAEDDIDDIYLFKTAVHEIQANVQLHMATDGVMLTRLLNSISKPDLIVLDINMPLKGGKECLVEIRQRTEFNDVRIIMLSTASNKQDMDYCLKNGASNYFVKPSSYEDLKIILTDLLKPSNSSNPE